MVGPNPFPGQAANPKQPISLFEQGRPEGGAPEDASVLVMPPRQQQPSKSRLWMRRFFLIIFVLFCLEIGIILTVAPWTPFWTDNSLLSNFPRIRELVTSNFARGLVSGLGLIDIWLAVTEAVRYRESPD